MKYGVIVLNFNNYMLTYSCVKKLLDVVDKNKIVIVDNASPNDSYSYLYDHFSDVENVDVIKSKENKGYAFGNNVGLLYLKERYREINYYVIMNPDVEIDDKNLFHKLINHMEEDKKIACISPLMIFNGILDLQNCFWDIPGENEIYLNWLSLDTKKKKNIIHYSQNKVYYVDVVPGSFFMISREFFNKIGKLDENTFLYNEEILLGIMVKNKGYKNAIAIDSFYLHNHPKGDRKNIISKLQHLKIANASRKYLCSKYYGLKSKIMLNIVCCINIIKSIVLHIGGNLLILLKIKK